MKDFKHLTLSDFCDMEVVLRTDNTATVIVEEDFEGMRVALPGFSTDPNKTDFEVQEEAYAHYMELMNRLNKHT